MPGKFDGRLTRRKIESALNGENYIEYIRKLYVSGMSGKEISDELLKLTGVFMSTRSIQRVIRGLGVSRNISEASRLMIARRRMSFQVNE